MSSVPAYFHDLLCEFDIIFNSWNSLTRVSFISLQDIQSSDDVFYSSEGDLTVALFGVVHSSVSHSSTVAIKFVLNMVKK